MGNAARADAWGRRGLDSGQRTIIAAELFNDVRTARRGIATHIATMALLASHKLVVQPHAQHHRTPKKHAGIEGKLGKGDLRRKNQSCVFH